jgi:hypothetical protein
MIVFSCGFILAEWMTGIGRRARSRSVKAVSTACEYPNPRVTGAVKHSASSFLIQKGLGRPHWKTETKKYEVLNKVDIVSMP